MLLKLMTYHDVTIQSLALVIGLFVETLLGLILSAIWLTMVLIVWQRRKVQGV